MPVLVGTVLNVTDGDTIKVQLSSGPVSVRFHSIDSPENDQPWGMDARSALVSRLDHQQVGPEADNRPFVSRLPSWSYS